MDIGMLTQRDPCEQHRCEGMVAFAPKRAHPHGSESGWESRVDVSLNSRSVIVGLGSHTP